MAKESKYKLHFLVIFIFLLFAMTVARFASFYTDKKGMDLIGGIVFGVLFIVYAVKLYEYNKNKKSINSR
ncbi:MAG: hypothetical protein KF825_12620 [Ferruginibacter sp.]|nr:hypothetical protein [Ferruginibacter sp.]